MMSERLAAFVAGLDQIDRSDPDALKDAFMNEVIENGGTYQSEPNTKPLLFGINLHGIHAVGETVAIAIRNWTMAANVALVNPAGDAVEDDGFITVHPPCGTPRNHAEEIRHTVAEATCIRSSYFNRLP